VIRPAVAAAGVTDHLWEISDIVKLVDDRHKQPTPAAPNVQPSAVAPFSRGIARHFMS